MPPVSGGGANVDLNQLNTMFINRTAFDDLQEKVRNLEVNDSKQDQDIEALKEAENNNTKIIYQHD